MNQDPFFDIQPTPPEQDKNGNTAKILSIIGLIVSLCCCSPVGVVLSAIALSYVSRSRKQAGYLTSDAEIARILSIISLVIGILGLLGNVIVGFFYAIAMLGSYA